MRVYWLLNMFNLEKVFSFATMCQVTCTGRSLDFLVFTIMNKLWSFTFKWSCVLSCLFYCRHWLWSKYRWMSIRSLSPWWNLYWWHQSLYLWLQEWIFRNTLWRKCKWLPLKSWSIWKVTIFVFLLLNQKVNLTHNI